MHWSELRTATLMLVARQRTMAWQSLPRRLVSAPTCPPTRGRQNRQKMFRVRHQAIKSSHTAIKES